MSDLSKIAETLKQTYNGDAWHGPSVMATLSNLSGDEARAKIGNGHSIIEIVSHMTSWRNFAIQKLTGHDSFDVSEKANFPTEPDWNVVLKKLNESQEELLNALTRFTEEKLQDQVPGRKYSYYKLLHGIIHHDLYHLGQIVMITKQFQS